MDSNHDKNEKIISKTLSICPKCEAVIDALIVEFEDRVYMKKTCVEHGEFKLRVHDDPVFFKSCIEGSSPTAEEFLRCGMTGCIACSRHVDYAKTIMIDVTERCNLNCTACFTNTGSRTCREPSVEEITSRLSQLKHRPAIQIFGGEPTLREDLPEIICAITSLGFVVKLASNGINLRDSAYVKTLRDSGLEWILLQFDGFSDEIYMKTRGTKLLDVKKEAIRTLSGAGIKICLVFMVVKGLNDTALGETVEYMMRHDSVMQLACATLSSVGRNGFEQEYSTTALDVISALDRETAGRIKAEDFMHIRSIGKKLFKLTGNRDFQQKSCFHMLLLHKRGDSGFFPVNRYFTPGGAIGNPLGIADLASVFWKDRGWDRIQADGKVKLITIEEFRSHDTVDLVEANRCNKVYMTDRGYIPPCIYNTKYRPFCWLSEEMAVRDVIGFSF